MGARPLRRAIQRYIEDPLADFVLRSQVPPGSTVLVEPAPGEASGEREVVLSVLEPAPKPTPVGVGAEGGAEESGDDDGAGAEAAAPDAPADAE
jgi:ATP-dependent Clp protease ATP-binding subunit ClpC